MRKAITLTLLFLFVQASAGCAAGPSEKRPEPGSSSRSSVSEQSGVTVTLRVQPESSKEECSFSLTLEVRNVSGEIREFTLPSAQVFEFVAFAAKGREVWRWSEGMVFAQALQPFSMKSGEYRAFKASLPASELGHGQYVIQGYFTGIPEARPEVKVWVSGAL